MEIEVLEVTKQRSKVCEEILRDLPEWFGIEEATQHYIKEVQKLPTFVAVADYENAGFICLKIHFEKSAEIYVMGVKKNGET